MSGGVAMVTWLCVTCCVQMLPLAVAVKVGFIKDKGMDEVFPGPVDRQHKDLPTGHMRPLGWQRESDGPVREADEMPNTREFYEDYISKNLPVVFRKGVKDVPHAHFLKWDDDAYLTETYGNVNVSVREFKGRFRDRINVEGRVMKMSKFLFDYMYDELYLASYIPPALMPDLPLPKCIRCGTVAEKLLSAHLWMSSGGTSSGVHAHDDHLLHCVLYGRRDFIIIKNSPNHRRAFDFQPDFTGALGGHSNMDPNIINVFRFKSVPKVPWRWSTLREGDCIFVPAGYIHQVRSYGRSISVTLEFAPLNNFDDTGCQLVEDEFVPLNDAIYALTWENGELRLTDTEMDESAVKDLLLMLLGRDEALKESKFNFFYDRIIGEGKGILKSHKVFDFISNDEDNVKRSDILNLTPEKLMKVANAFNSGYELKQKAKEEEANRPKLSRTANRGPADEL